MRLTNRLVFVNCPFDSDYAPMLRAISFTILSCGSEPVCALDTIDSAQLRYDKICSMIAKSRLGLHDLSRTELNRHGLPRFNMPFELGLFMGCLTFGGPEHARKSALILDREPYRYQQFISDLAGVDPEAHGGRQEVAMEKVRHWLRCNTAEILPGPAHILRQFQTYLCDLPDLCHSLLQDPLQLSFTDEKHLMKHWLKGMRAAELE